MEWPSSIPPYALMVEPPTQYGGTAHTHVMHATCTVHDVVNPVDNGEHVPYGNGDELPGGEW